MIQSFKTMLTGAFGMLKVPLIILGIIIATFSIITIGWYLKYRYLDKIKPKTGEHYKIPRRNLLLKIFWDTPKQYAKDLIERDPEDFQKWGVICFVGRQGSGKSSSMCKMTLDLLKEYPKAKVISNMNFKGAEQITDWTDLIDKENGTKGMIIQLDEIQNWFSSKQSLNFPPEMLQMITTQRKQKRLLLCTAQQFYMLSKDIRTQITEIHKCMTLFKSLCIVHVVEPIITSEGEVEKMKHKRFYCYTHNEELRNSYDTYQVIESLRKSGFVDRQLKDETKIYINTEPPKKGKLKR